MEESPCGGRNEAVLDDEPGRVRPQRRKAPCQMRSQRMDPRVAFGSRLINTPPAPQSPECGLRRWVGQRRPLAGVNSQESKRRLNGVLHRLVCRIDSEPAAIPLVIFSRSHG
jgi:hypothetical protein